MATQQAPELSKYDTGEVAEPHVWRTTRPAYMGRVDFDNDEGSTLATVRMERNENGGYDTAKVLQELSEWYWALTHEERDELRRYADNGED